MMVLLLQVLLILVILALVYLVGTKILAWLGAPAPLQEIFWLVFIIICIIVIFKVAFGLLGASPSMGGLF